MVNGADSCAIKNIESTINGRPLKMRTIMVLYDTCIFAVKNDAILRIY